ncbi:ABC transporter permease [Candidatus Haliotispira prima]|uniref:ABC transporter permease n=1 Tax=Candidatus Haliotispira prima TaxID=3034016 RepID=A0ABY8MIZ0_9SPIO|nr:ABC transporter permease [Candidatus Haliotispira prima]
MSREDSDSSEEIVRSQYFSFLQDAREAFGHYELWLNWAWQDIRLRYVRSKIGPFWITISTVMFISTLGFLRSVLSGESMVVYLPFIAFGLVPWQMMAEIINTSPEVYAQNKNFLTSMRVNPLILILKTMMSTVFIFLHDLVIFVPIIIFLRIPVNWNLLFVIPGFLLVMANIFLFALNLSLMGVRYQDFGQIVRSITRILFFLTPIYWSPDELVKGRLVALVNPFTHYIDLIRAPFLGEAPELRSWIFSFLFICIMGGVSVFTYRRKASRIAFWV